MFKSFRFVLAICVMVCFGALLGCGGGGDSSTSPVADNGGLVGNQVLNGFVSGDALSNNVRASVRSLVNPRPSVVVQAGYFDASGIFQPFPDGQASGTTDANGMYTLYNLPNRVNIVIRALVNAGGATDEDKFYFVVVPSVPATGVASAPTMDPNSKYQAYLVREGNKLGVDLNIADILAVIPPSELAGIKDQIAQIVGHFVNREKARDRTATNFGVSAALMAQWKNAGFEYSRTIIAQMEKGEISRDEGWRMINQFMAEKAKELGIPPDAMMAFQDCDDQFIRTPLQTAFQAIPGIIGDFNRDFEIRKHLDILNGLRLAFQAFKGTLVLTEADALKLETLIAELTTAIQRASTADQVSLIFRGDVNFKTIFDTVNLILKGLGLFLDAGDGTTLMSKIQFLDDAGALLLVGTAFPTNPNPEQMAEYQNQFREKLMAKIALYNDGIKIKIKLNEAQIKALVFLLQGLPMIDMPIAPPAQPGQEMPMTGAVIMGVIENITANPITVNNKVYNFAINPPPGFPAAPEGFGGHLALVDFQQPFAMPADASTVAYAYAGRYVDPPSTGVAPTFLITGRAQTEAGQPQDPVAPEGTFVGQLLKEVANVPHPYYLMNSVPGHTNEKIVLWGNNVDFATLETWVGQNPPVVVKAVGTIASGGPEVGGIVTLILDVSSPIVKMDTANVPTVVSPVPLPRPVLPNPLPTTFTGIPVNFQGTWISDLTPANKLEVTASEVTLKNDAGVLAGPYKHDPVNRQFMQLIPTANGTVLAYGQVSVSDVVLEAWTSIVAPNGKLFVKRLENGAEVVESFHK